MGWQLEVGKMFLYMAFPVGLFHLFNQPQFFESYVIKTKEEWYPPNIDENGVKLRQMIDEFQKEREEKKLQQLKEQQDLLANPI